MRTTPSAFEPTDEVSLVERRAQRVSGTGPAVSTVLVDIGTSPLQLKFDEQSE